MRSLKLRKLDGTEFVLQVPLDQLILETRKIIEEKTGIKELEQRLIYKGRLLSDDMVI